MVTRFTALCSEGLVTLETRAVMLFRHKDRKNLKRGNTHEDIKDSLLAMGSFQSLCPTFFYSDTFVRYYKQFAQNINSTLAASYRYELTEPKMVGVLEKMVNNLNGLEDRYHGNSISTKAIFIHGNRSFVEFEFEGSLITREIGDLIFIISLVVGGEKYLEKMTITQFKKDKIASRGNLCWDIGNKAQLYLLSRFPPFSGVGKSLIPMRNFYLSNISGCLGSYGLLFRPGDFVFISAPKLDSMLGAKNKITLNQLHVMGTAVVKYDYFNYYDVFSPSCCYGQNAFDFSSEYLRLRVGEPIHSCRIHNGGAKLLLGSILAFLKRRGGAFETFVKEFYKYEYAWFDRSHPVEQFGNNDNDHSADLVGGLGIVHTTIYLDNY